MAVSGNKEPTKWLWGWNTYPDIGTRDVMELRHYFDLTHTLQRTASWASLADCRVTPVWSVSCLPAKRGYFGSPDAVFRLLCDPLQYSVWATLALSSLDRASLTRRFP
jgi:hypothetical protein